MEKINACDIKVNNIVWSDKYKQYLRVDSVHYDAFTVTLIFTNDRFEEFGTYQEVEILKLS